jgi:hypothetical protein
VRRWPAGTNLFTLPGKKDAAARYHLRPCPYDVVAMHLPPSDRFAGFIGEGADEIYIDSGATFHMTHDRHLLHDYRPLPKDTPGVTIGNMSTMECAGVGTLKVMVRTERKEPEIIEFRDVTYVPGLACTLLSFGTIDRKGYEFRSKKGRLYAYDEDELIFVAKREDSNL